MKVIVNPVLKPDGELKFGAIRPIKKVEVKYTLTGDPRSYPVPIDISASPGTQGVFNLYQHCPIDHLKPGSSFDGMSIRHVDSADYIPTEAEKLAETEKLSLKDNGWVDVDLDLMPDTIVPIPAPAPVQLTLFQCLKKWYQGLPDGKHAFGKMLLTVFVVLAVLGLAGIGCCKTVPYIGKFCGNHCGSKTNVTNVVPIPPPTPSSISSICSTNGESVTVNGDPAGGYIINGSMHASGRSTITVNNQRIYNPTVTNVIERIVERPVESDRPSTPAPGISYPSTTTPHIQQTTLLLSDRLACKGSEESSEETLNPTYNDETIERCVAVGKFRQFFIPPGWTITALNMSLPSCDYDYSINHKPAKKDCTEPVHGIYVYGFTNTGSSPLKVTWTFTKPQQCYDTLAQR